jgi:hypothetical protein
VPDGNDVVVTVSVDAAMVSVRGVEVDAPVLSVTVTVIANVPVLAGTPLMAPVEESVRPVGSEPDEAAQLYEEVPPEAESWVE